MKKQSINQEAQHASLLLATRRHFLKQCGLGLGGLALGSLVGSCNWDGNADMPIHLWFLTP